MEGMNVASDTTRHVPCLNGLVVVGYVRSLSIAIVWRYHGYARFPIY